MIDQKFNIQPENIPQKLFSKQNVGLFIFGKIKQNHVTIFLLHGFCLISPEIRSIFGWGLSHLKPDIERYVLSTESFFREICGLRYCQARPQLQRQVWLRLALIFISPTTHQTEKVKLDLILT